MALEWCRQQVSKRFIKKLHGYLGPAALHEHEMRVLTRVLTWRSSEAGRAVHIWGPWRFKHHQNSTRRLWEREKKTREDFPEREKKSENGAGERKKIATCWAVGRRGVWRRGSGTGSPTEGVWDLRTHPHTPTTHPPITHGPPSQPTSQPASHPPALSPHPTRPHWPKEELTKEELTKRGHYKDFMLETDASSKMMKLTICSFRKDEQNKILQSQTDQYGFEFHNDS